MAYLTSSQQLSRLPYDRNFWIDLQQTNDPFVLATGWKSVLRGKTFGCNWEAGLMRNGIEPFARPKNVTAQVIDNIDLYRERHGNKTGFLDCLVTPDGSRIPYPSADNVFTELQQYRLALKGRIAGNNVKELLGGVSKPIVLDEADNLLYSWNADEGLLVDNALINRDVLTDSKVSSDVGKGYSIDAEYFFAVPSENHYVITVANEINTNQPLFGIRRDFSQDWQPYADSKSLTSSQIRTHESVVQYRKLLDELVDLLTS